METEFASSQASQLTTETGLKQEVKLPENLFSPSKYERGSFTIRSDPVVSTPRSKTTVISLGDRERQGVILAPQNGGDSAQF